MEQININEKLDEILIKNKIIQESSFEQAVHELQRLQNLRTTGKKIGLYGIGIEAEGLLHFISEHIYGFKIDYCFDKTIKNYKYNEIISDTSVYKIERIHYMNVDYIILGSYRYRETFKKKLDELNYQGQIVDLYNFLGKYISNHYSDYEIIYKLSKLYSESEGEAKRILLQKLIKEYILLKDFKSAFHFMNVYIEEGYNGYRQYEQLKIDLNTFIQEIKKCISARASRDIVVNWVDALSFYDISQFSFLQQKASEGVCFKNAYTVMPWTTETLKTILFGEYPIEGKLFLKESFSEKNTKLLTMLKRAGYIFGYCGIPRIARRFDADIYAPVQYYENKFSGSMQKQWDALNILCQNPNPICVLVHTLRETHEPFVGGRNSTLIEFGTEEYSWDQDNCKRQAGEAGMYINNQLEYYEEFYKDAASVVYMSDHGRIGNNPMNEQKIHIILTVDGRDIVPYSVYGMFSLVDFPELIEKIIRNKNDWDGLTGDYVLIENLDAYNEIVVQRTLSGAIDRKEMYQCRGVVTMSDSYYLYATKDEYYFERTEPDNNKIDRPECQRRISLLRKLCGSEFIDISKYDKFEYSRLLYGAL